MKVLEIRYNHPEYNRPYIKIRKLGIFGFYIREYICLRVWQLSGMADWQCLQTGKSLSNYSNISTIDKFNDLMRVQQIIETDTWHQGRKGRIANRER